MSSQSLVWVPSFALKPYGYGYHCPVVGIWRDEWLDPSDGVTTRVGAPQWEGNVVDENALLDDAPGFLVLYLAGIDPDPTVEAAALLVRDSLRSMFHTCGDDVPV
jgi:hypothetical protein